MVQAGRRSTVDNYFDRVTTPHILEAVREAKGDASALTRARRGWVRADACARSQAQVQVPGHSALGFVAAALTSLSYVPQIQKALPKDSTGDLSLKMLVALFAGLALWIVYGLIVEDIVIVIANCVGAALVAVVLGCKVRDIMAQRREKFEFKER
jgi:MtN3 and saliva related transmembrane protein